MRGLGNMSTSEICPSGNQAPCCPRQVGRGCGPFMMIYCTPTVRGRYGMSRTTSMRSMSMLPSCVRARLCAPRTRS